MVGDRVQALHPGLLDGIVRVSRGFPGFQALKGDALLAEQRAQALVADVVDHPCATRNSASFDRLHAENGSVNFGGRPPLYRGYSAANPSALKLRITSRTRSSLVNATLAIAGASMPGGDGSTICARRQVTTDPLPRRTIRTSRAPSSIIDRTHPQAISHGPSLRDGTGASGRPGRLRPRLGALTNGPQH